MVAISLFWLSSAMRAVIEKKNTLTATNTFRNLADLIMIDLLVGVLKIRTRGNLTGFRKIPTSEQSV
jgi:hypothetical protein